MNEHRPVRVFSTLATRKALDDELGVAYTEATGGSWDVHYDPTTELARRLRAGEVADVVIAVTSALHDLAAEGLVDGASIVPLARTRVGVAIAPGAPRPDLSTVDSFVAAMVDARSVAYSQTGASGIYLRSVLAELGILDDVSSRATVLEKGFTATAIVDGRADVAVQQLSELAFVDGVEIVGALPADIDHVTEFSAAITPAATHESARGVVQFLASSTARRPYERSGLEPV